ncbi:MAG: hypothetical protein EKK39_05020 [Sphingobacteriales bacterium]|uniref:hypothetical protein n=1 Tax=Hydrotalea flava TaxID=714549 RepID=UPI000833DE90|nr:hypothetical protein [Hydrotalea flava]RTL53195.1 MAG: hypothetical protein EKK39_05020 [Sphingobacteriales bacterium]
MVEKLFSHLDKQLDKDGIIVHKGKLVDASIVEVLVQHNSRDENKQPKEGNIPLEWDENKLRQKDTDAQWVAIEQVCRIKNIESCIHEKGYRGNPLTKRQQQRNRNKSGEARSTSPQTKWIKT